MGICGVFLRLSAVFAALFAVLVGCLIADVPGQLGLWRHLDKFPYTKGITPVVHDGPWGFNHSTLSETALAGRTVLVTGANAGLGYASAHYLALHGASVILACRTQKKCDEAVNRVKADAPSASLVPLVLDLGSFQSIKQFAEEVLQTTPKLHSLILNAGIYRYPFGVTVDGIETQIGVNHFGHAYLVQLLESRLKQSASKELPATIVVVSSAEHYNSYPEGVRLSLSALNDPSTYDTNLAYGQSKLANVLYAQELAERLRPFGILVNSVHPGGVDTSLTDHIIDSLNVSFPSLAQTLHRFGVIKGLRLFVANSLWTAKDAALTQVYAAVSPEIITKRVHGKYFHPIARESLPCRIHATNTTLQKGLWEFTEQVIKEKAK